MPATAKQILNGTPAWVADLPRNVAEKVEEGVTASKQALKRACNTAEELTEETAHRIKRHPWHAAALALGIGVGIGIGAGLLLGRASGARRRGLLRWFR